MNRRDRGESSHAEEIERVVPVTAALREAFAGDDVVLSVDTTKPEVAQRAVEAGANLVNDISGGTFYDGEMLHLVADLGVPYCLMHMRGDSTTMMSLTNYDDDDVVRIVDQELRARVDSAISAGIHRWNICVDPGIGFAKTHDQNVELIRHVGSFGQRGMYPILVGASRKGFLGTIAGKELAADRDAATHATTAAAIQQGAFIVRGTTCGLVDVARVSDAIWRH